MNLGTIFEKSMTLRALSGQIRKYMSVEVPNYGYVKELELDEFATKIEKEIWWLLKYCVIRVWPIRANNQRDKLAKDLIDGEECTHLTGLAGACKDFLDGARILQVKNDGVLAFHVVGHGVPKGGTQAVWFALLFEDVDGKENGSRIITSMGVSMSMYALHDELCAIGMVDASELENCACCLNVMMPGRHEIYKQHCGHCFHNNCYETWAAQCRSNGCNVTCPVCRNVERCVDTQE